MKLPLRPLHLVALLAFGASCALPAFAQPQQIDQSNLYRYWILLNTSVTMDAPNSGLNLEKPGCAAVTYTIGSDGVPRQVEVVRLVPKSDLASVAKSAVSQFRYGPSLTNRAGNPVSTYYVVPFNAPTDPAARAAMLKPCALEGYGS
ncbi:MAG: energy transducer TonB [Rhodanobacter sp.]